MGAEKSQSVYANPMHISGEWQQFTHPDHKWGDLWVYCIKWSTKYSADILLALLL